MNRLSDGPTKVVEELEGLDVTSKRSGVHSHRK